MKLKMSSLPSAVSDADQNVNEQYIDYVVEDIVLQEGGDIADKK